MFGTGIWSALGDGGETLRVQGTHPSGAHHRGCDWQCTTQTCRGEVDSRALVGREDVMTGIAKRRAQRVTLGQLATDDAGWLLSSDPQATKAEPRSRPFRPLKRVGGGETRQDPGARFCAVYCETSLITFPVWRSPQRKPAANCHWMQRETGIVLLLEECNRVCAKPPLSGPNGDL